MKITASISHGQYGHCEYTGDHLVEAMRSFAEQMVEDGDWTDCPDKTVIVRFTNEEGDELAVFEIEHGGAEEIHLYEGSHFVGAYTDIEYAKQDAASAKDATIYSRNGHILLRKEEYGDWKDPYA